MSFSQWGKIVVWCAVVSCLVATPAFAQTGGLSEETLQLFDQAVVAPIQGGTGVDSSVPATQPNIETQDAPEIEGATEGDPRNCSYAFATPQGPVIITVGRNIFGNCPDSFASLEGEVLSTFGSQIPPFIKDLLRGAAGNLLNRLISGFGSPGVNIGGNDYYPGTDEFDGLFDSGYDITDSYQYGGYDFSQYFNDGPGGSGSGSFIYTGGSGSGGQGVGSGATGGQGTGGAGSQPDVTSGNQSIGDRICSSRPWAEGFLGKLLPDVVFDGLCNRLGFGTGGGIGSTGTFSNTATLRGITCSPSIVRPGTSATLRFSCGNASLTAIAGFTLSDAATREVRVTPTGDAVYGIRCSDGFEDFCSVEVAPPSADVWAEPQSVRLGARTTIYWTSTGVDSCRVTGPSFSENTLSGGSATVPIGNATTYIITCTAPDGSVVSDRTTVNIAL